MRRKYKYSIVVFSSFDNLELGVKEIFLSPTLAKKYKKEYSASLDKHFYCRILKEEIIPKVFRQSTIYDFLEA